MKIPTLPIDSRMLTTSGQDPRIGKQTAKLKEAASQFEALLVTQMLQSARASGDGSWAGSESGQESTMVELGEQQFAQALASSGGLGIAKMVVKGLTNHENR